MRSLRARWAVVALVLVSACAGSHGAAPPDDAGVPSPPADSGSSPPDGEGSPPTDAGGTGGSDAAPPADANPFPADPQGGEFAWVVSASGASPFATAVDAAGDIFVAAVQTGAFAMGDVHLPAPTAGQAMLVLELAPDGTPLWARAFNGARHVSPSAIAITPTGAVVVGGAFREGQLQIGDTQLTAGSSDRGFVAALDGRDGIPRWSTALSKLGDVGGIVAGPDATGADAIYVFADADASITVGGQALASGKHLIRFDEDGTPRWAASLRSGVIGHRTLALDPQRGPVVVGNFALDPVLASPPTVVADAGGLTVIGFDPDGQVRFVRPIISSDPPFDHHLAVAPTGDIYVASGADFFDTVVDGHVLHAPGLPSAMFMIRLTPDGHYAGSHTITAAPIPTVRDAASDGDGAGYMVARCSGKVDVEPEIACASPDEGSVIVSYDPDNAYRWATFVAPADVEAIAPTAGHRLVVVGESLRVDGTVIHFGGVDVPTNRLFIAALATGPARLPTPLPAPPAIARVEVAGATDHAVREGSTVQLVVHGSALDHVTSAALGDLEIHVSPTAGSATALQLSAFVPHGHPPGLLPLSVGNAGGTAHLLDAIDVTPVIVTPTGAANGRGTSSSPLSLCSLDKLSEPPGYGDVVQVAAGTYACTEVIALPPGMTVRGAGRSSTIVSGTSFADFPGFTAVPALGVPGTATLEGMTLVGGSGSPLSSAMITVSPSDADLAINDVALDSPPRVGLLVRGGHVALRDYHVAQSREFAIWIQGGSVDASGVSIDAASGRISIGDANLRLRDSNIATALVVGDTNFPPPPGTREVMIAGTSFGRSIASNLAHLTITGSTIAPAPPPPNSFLDPCIRIIGGELTMSHTALQGCATVGIDALDQIDLGQFEDAPFLEANLFLDHVEITRSPRGISLFDRFATAARTAKLAIHDSHVQSQDVALELEGVFSTIDLGTLASPGNNRFETTAGAPAIDAGVGGVPIDAHGTTLNGVSFDGQDVIGPAEVAGGYRLAAATEIRF